MSAPWRIIVIISLLSLSAYNFTYVLKRNSLGFLSQPNFFGSAQESDNFGGEAEINELDGCYHVFIDVGSNIGNQVRKIFEPHLFINATFLSIFDKYFGDADLRHLPGSVCVIGFEPNPKHAKGLTDLEKAYLKCGWKIRMHTTTAAAHSYGLATFYTDQTEDFYEWGGSIVESKIANQPGGVTKVIRLADFILNRVVPRKLPHWISAENLERKPNVVMKLDIEGSELEVLPDLLVSGALQHLDLVTVEYHPTSYEIGDVRASYLRGLEKAIDTLTFLSQKLRLQSQINVKTIEDESYGTVRYPLPECSAKD